MTDDLVQWDRVKGLEKSKLDVLLGQRRKLKQAEEEIGEQISTINDKILGALAVADVKSVAVGDTRVTLVPGGATEKLDKKKLWSRLLELGVKEKVVARAYAYATEMGVRVSSIKVTEPKAEGKGKG